MRSACSARRLRGRVNVIASDVPAAMIAERGQQDMDSEIGRFPRLFRAARRIPGLTWPTSTFHRADDGLARPARGADHPYRPRPHRRRHGGLAAEGAACCSPATWSSSAPRPIAATRISPTGPPRSTACAAMEAERAGARPRRGADRRRERSGEASRSPRAFTRRPVSARQGQRRRRAVAQGGLRFGHGAMRPEIR